MNDIPDAATLAFYRERLCMAGVIDELFEVFESYLRDQRLEARGGQIIDATLIQVPRQGNSREDNKEIKENRIPEGCDENPNRLRQKDLYAPCVYTNGVNYLAIRTTSVFLWNIDLSGAMP